MICDVIKSDDNDDHRRACFISACLSACPRIRELQAWNHEQEAV